MKRCPECRRDYYDDTLLFCLDDGNPLLEGPATASSGDEPVIRGYQALLYSKLGQREKALNELNWLKQEAPRRYVPSIAFALAYIALGQKSEAFEWLEKDVDDRTIYASSYAIESAFDDVRDDPRFKAMLKRMNLPE